MRWSYVSLHRYLLSGTLGGLVLLFAVSASADPVLRIVSFTTAGPDQQQQALKLADETNKIYLAAKGCQWVKFWYDASSGESGSVSLWDSQADVEAFLKSDAYKPVPEKLKPLMKGEMSSKIYKVYEPKK